MNTYKPLPKELRLGFSDIHDIGVFAKEKIWLGHDFGISHLKVGDQLFRTPLGGFINHSDTSKLYQDNGSGLRLQSVETHYPSRH